MPVSTLAYLAAASATTSVAAQAAAPVCVLLLTGDVDRIVALRRQIHRLLPGARIEADVDPLDGLLTAARMPADLVIVDAMLAAGSAPALSRHIARVAPEATVLVFDELADEGEPGRRARPWYDVEPSVMRWRDVRDGANPR